MIKYINFLFLLILGFCDHLAAQSNQDSIPFGNNKAAGKYMTIRGIKMYYEVYGHGEPLLLIHGNGGSISNFTNQIPYFSKNYQVIIADSRAQGKTIDTKDSLSYEMMADDLNALMDNLHVKDANVIGWSDGGIDGLLLAMRHPDKVKKLAVTGANLWPDSTALTPFVYKMMVKDADSLRKLPKTPENKAQLKLVDLMCVQPNIKLEQLHSIKCPVLVIGGDHDVILPAHTMAIAQAIPNSYLWIIPNSGHSTPIFKKDQFNPLISDFFKTPYRKIEGGATFQ
ncbi:alpha/beta fold hydrolase [Pedobacter sp. L105]|uniref:alpha/beta fold hydrolase n=1 Tax=Pedobacter sp. L105 TaxID=1641871 RepID=UPI00131DA9A2|nr:alpha/beta hydrolase [Pedobacter sp. L105]